MQAFLARVRQWEESREGVAADDQEGDAVFDGGFRVPGNVYDRLFDYQKTGAKGMRNRMLVVQVEVLYDQEG